MAQLHSHISAVRKGVHPGVKTWWAGSVSFNHFVLSLCLFSPCVFSSKGALTMSTQINSSNPFDLAEDREEIN